ncbi:sucrose transport protein SUT2-like [Iris pallida]|uniref:Sucrose transport protein SUT2-like n=1 Tax=Iris pallida TaxID=29817 RepID=A0AAX6IGL6_IRIPA|nr:sucrose transport protein SUT2-like [Iris pallida]
MALGNVLGFATGSYSGWFTLLPFTVTKACSVNCANLKAAFLIDIVILALTTYICISSVQEVPLSTADEIAHLVDGTQQLNNEQEAFLWEMMGAFRYLTVPIWTIMNVISLTWFGWFPFFLFDTDWMGREIYRGKPNEGQNYHSGVRLGAFGFNVKFSCSWIYFSGSGKALQKMGIRLDLGNFKHCHGFMFYSDALNILHSKQYWFIKQRTSSRWNCYCCIDCVCNSWCTFGNYIQYPLCNDFYSYRAIGAWTRIGYGYSEFSNCDTSEDEEEACLDTYYGAALDDTCELDPQEDPAVAEDFPPTA